MRRFLDFPSRHIWSVRSMYSVVPQSRPSPLAGRRDTERNTEGIGCALSAGVNRRELPSSIQRGFFGKTSPTKCNFLKFFRLWVVFWSGPAIFDWTFVVSTPEGNYCRSCNTENIR